MLCKATHQKPPKRRSQTLPGSGAQGGRSVLDSEARELSDQTKRLSATAMAAPSRTGSKGLGPPLASKRGHECDIATQRLAKWCSPVDDKVKTALTYHEGALGWDAT